MTKLLLSKLRYLLCRHVCILCGVSSNRFYRTLVHSHGSLTKNLWMCLCLIENALNHYLFDIKKLTICRLQHMAEKSIKMSFQWHTRTPLTWDFDHELSRCTYPGNLQWAPQRASARAKQWWVFGYFESCSVHMCRVITAIRHFDSLVLVFPIQLLWQEPVLGKRKMPFPPTRRPSRLCLRRQPHWKGPRKPPMPGHQRFVLSSLLSLPRYAIFRG